VLDYIYPEEERRFFTDREHHLGLLALSKTLLVQGIRTYLALSGFRRVGKTVILKESLRRHLLEKTDGGVAAVYLNLSRLAFTPQTVQEAFVLETLGLPAVSTTSAATCSKTRFSRYVGRRCPRLCCRCWPGRWRARA
jgi:hypothetical protein